MSKGCGRTDASRRRARLSARPRASLREPICIQLHAVCNAVLLPRHVMYALTSARSLPRTMRLEVVRSPCTRPPSCILAMASPMATSTRSRSAAQGIECIVMGCVIQRHPSPTQFMHLRLPSAQPKPRPPSPAPPWSQQIPPCCRLLLRAGMQVAGQLAAAADRPASCWPRWARMENSYRR